MENIFLKEYSELDELLVSLSKNISSALKNNEIGAGYFNSTKYLKGKVAHNYVCSLIGKTGVQLGYRLMKEKYFRFVDGSLIRPDIQLLGNTDLFFLVEYESTNSSDSRVIEDMERYGRATTVGTSDLPKYWLVIYTLPDQSVSDWPTWDYNKRDWVFDLVTENPHKFYKKAYKNPSYLSGVRCPKVPRSYIYKYPGVSKYTENKKRWNNCRLFMINLTIQGLEIDFPEQFSRRYDFEATFDHF